MIHFSIHSNIIDWVLEQSVCNKCHESCFACFGGASDSDCTICKADYYLNITNTNYNTGKCYQKVAAISSESKITYYVTGKRSSLQNNNA